MADHPGVAARLAVGDATTAMTQLAFLSESLAETRGHIDGNGTCGTRAHYTERVREGAIIVGGNISLNPQTNEMAYLLPKCHGAAASSESYPLGETPGSFIALKEFSSSNVHSFPALYVNQMTLRGSYNTPVIMDLECIGTSSVTPGATMPTGSSLTFNTANDFFTFHDAALVIAGTTYAMADFTLTINNAIAVRQVNSRVASGAIATDRVITLSVTLHEGDVTFTTFTDGDVTASLTLTTNSQTLTYVVNSWRPQQQTPIVNGRGHILYPLSGQCFRTSAAAELTPTLDSTPPP